MSVLGLHRWIVSVVRPRVALRLSSGWIIEPDGRMDSCDVEWTDPWVLA